MNHQHVTSLFRRVICLCLAACLTLACLPVMADDVVPASNMNPPQNYNTTAKVIYSSYEGDILDPEHLEDNAAELRINDSKIDKKTGEFTVSFNANENDQTVTISLGVYFVRKFTSIIINGEDYSSYIPKTTDQLLDAYDADHTWVNIEVPRNYDENGQDLYTISTVTAACTSTDMAVGNFLWTYNPAEEYRKNPDGQPQKDENNNPILNDDFIGHGKMELVNVTYKYNNQIITYKADQIPSNLKYLQWNEPVGNTDFGFAVLPAGANVTVRLIPEPGYQLVDFTINGGVFTAGEDISTFTFEIKPGTFHLGAHFAQVDNKVTSGIDQVSDGSVTLSENDLTSGTALLSVSDAADKQPSDFAQQAGEGYYVDSVMNLELKQVVYKGTPDKMWEKPLSPTSNVEVTLDLNHAYNDPVVIHQKSNGSYETLTPTSYDSGTNTITFTTSSFSPFAIASKSPIEPEPPQSGTFIVNYDSWGGEASIQVDGTTITNGGSRSYTDPATPITFQLSPPADRVGQIPLVDVEFLNSNNTSSIITLTVENNTFTIIPSELNQGGDSNAPFIVYVWWSFFDWLEPDDNQFMVITNVFDGDTMGQITLSADGLVDSMTMETGSKMTKYIFKKGTSVTARFLPASNHDMPEIWIGDVRYSNDPSDRPLDDLLVNGEYQYTITTLPNNESVIYLESIFDHHYVLKGISAKQHQLMCACGQVSGEPENHSHLDNICTGCGDYAILNGDGQDWTQNSNSELSFRSSGEFSQFNGLYLDGEVVPSQNYTARQGSTIVTLKESYLRTLSLGEHRLTFRFNGGAESNVTFLVKPAPAVTPTPAPVTPAAAKPAPVVTSIPKTSDDNPLALWFILLLVSASGLGGVLILKKKHR